MLTKEEASTLFAVLATASLTGIGFAIGGTIGATIIGGIGINLGSTIIQTGASALRERWLSSGDGMLNRDIQAAIARAFIKALSSLETQYFNLGEVSVLAANEKESIRELFKELRRQTDEHFPFSIQHAIKEAKIKEYVYDPSEVAIDKLWKKLDEANALSTYSGHFKSFLRENLFNQVQIWFADELLTNSRECNRAWRAFQRLLLDGIQASVQAMQVSQDLIHQDLQRLGPIKAQLDELKTNVESRFPNEPFQQALERAADQMRSFLQNVAETTRRTEKKVETIEHDLVTVIELLRNELQQKNSQIQFLQDELLLSRGPSLRAQELAGQIPNDADAYSLALKAIAESRFDVARKLLHESQNTKEIETTQIYQASGDTEYFSGHYRKAIPLYKKVLNVKPDNLAALDSLGLTLHQTCAYGEAESTFKHALTIREQLLGPEHVDLAKTLTNLGAIYLSIKNHTAAESAAIRARRLIEIALGPEHPDTAVVDQLMAGILASQGDFNKAQPFANRALTLRERAFGLENRDTIQSMGELASIYEFQGRTIEAESLYVRTLALAEKTLGPKHPDLALSLNNLAQLYADKNLIDEAAHLYEKALSLTETTLGQENPDRAVILNNLAQLYQKQEDYISAERLFKQALDIKKKVFGLENSSTATALNNLAGLYLLQCKYQSAESYCKKALRIRERVLGLDHPMTAQSYENYGYLLLRMKRFAKAKKAFARFRKILDSYGKKTGQSFIS